MRVELSSVQQEVRTRFAALFDDELMSDIRRMGESPTRSAVDPAGAAADARTSRAAVWDALVDLGATRLLVPEKFGGEDVGHGAVVVLCELLGAALYQGPLLDTLLAQEVLLGSPDIEADRIAEIAAGAAVAVAPRATTADVLHRPGGPLGDDGGALDGVRRFVGSVPECRYLLAVAAHDAGTRSALVAADGLTVRRYDEVTRGQLFEVTFAGVPVLSWYVSGPTAWAKLVARARIRHAAYLVGTAQGALDLAVSRARARRQFGRPIGRFQALAFRLAELATRLTATRWFVRGAAAAVDVCADTDADCLIRAAQALAMASDVVGWIVSTAMQVHGAHGLTEDADIQLFHRRALVDRIWLGTPVELRQEVYPMLTLTLDNRLDTL
ncbi:MAG TPA: acyl-CoA dehydrogenase family protein [Pseudonocardiaceae bacterium]|nr:acyl-CoA dehydrogenase family protein [Pseudonocardiaceae bacterium]